MKRVEWSGPPRGSRPAASPTTFSFFCRPAEAPSKRKIKVDWLSCAPALLLNNSINNLNWIADGAAGEEKKTNPINHSSFIYENEDWWVCLFFSLINLISSLSHQTTNQFLFFGLFCLIEKRSFSFFVSSSAASSNSIAASFIKKVKFTFFNYGVVGYGRCLPQEKKTINLI